jgi:hypothetical protein
MMLAQKKYMPPHVHSMQGLSAWFHFDLDNQLQNATARHLWVASLAHVSALLGHRLENSALLCTRLTSRFLSYALFGPRSTLPRTFWMASI